MLPRKTLYTLGTHISVLKILFFKTITVTSNSHHRMNTHINFITRGQFVVKSNKKDRWLILENKWLVRNVLLLPFRLLGTQDFILGACVKFFQGSFQKKLRNCRVKIEDSVYGDKLLLFKDFVQSFQDEVAHTYSVHMK